MKEIFAFFFFFEKDLEQLIIKNAVKTIKIKIKNNDPSNFFFFFFFFHFTTTKKINRNKPINYNKK